MSLEEFSHKVIALEKQFDVWSWQCNGVAVWPYIRTKLYLAFKKDLLKGSKKPSITFSEKLGFLLTSIVTLLRLLLKGKRKAALLSNAAFRSPINSTYIDRICDPVMDELLVLGKEPVLLEFASDFRYRKPRLQEQHVEDVQPLFLLLSSIFKRRSNVVFQPKDWDVFLSALALISPAASKELERSKMIPALRTWWSNVLAWKVILRLIRPQIVFINCFYDEKGMSMVTAAKLLGIRTVDLQHGVQGDVHLAYSSWTLPSEPARAILPDYFFVWNEASAKTIRSWGGADRLAGYPWIDWWKSGKIKMNAPVPQGIILYTLQPLDDPFPPELVSCLRQVQGTLYVRVHPHELSKIDFYKDAFTRSGIDMDVEFEAASNLPLPYLLTRTSVHITKWSTVALEAFYFRVPTLFIHRNGLDIFAQQVPPDFLFFGKTVREVLDEFSADEKAVGTGQNRLTSLIQEVMP